MSKDLQPLNANLIVSVLKLQAQGYDVEQISTQLEIPPDQVTNIIKHGVQSSAMLNKLLMLSYSSELVNENAELLRKVREQIVVVDEETGEVYVNEQLLKAYSSLIKPVMSAATTMATSSVSSERSLANEGDDGRTTVQQGINLTITTTNPRELFEQVTSNLLHDGDIVEGEEELNHDDSGQ